MINKYISNQMVSTKKTCSICLEYVRKEMNLKLNCDCKYAVHFKCYNKWWKINHCCIICHTPSPQPKRYGTPRHNKRKTLIRKINRRRNNHPNVIEFPYPIAPNEITFWIKLYIANIFKIVLFTLFIFFIKWLINSSIH